jgi:hypothetical protein
MAAITTSSAPSRLRGRGGLQLGLDAVIAEQEDRNGLAEA